MSPLEEGVSFAERPPFVWSFRRPARSAGNEGPGVGCGEAAKGTRPELFVDVTNPRSPVTLGLFPVKDLPSIGDVLITPDLSVILSSEISLTGGGKAVIIGGLSSIGFGPMRLFVADNALANIGSRMALTQDGILVSSDRIYVSSVQTTENGVHTAALRETGLIPRPPATLTKVVEVASGTPTQEETTEDIPINVMVVPFDTGVTQAVLEILTNGVAAMPPITLPLVGNQAVWKLAKGFKRVLDGATTAMMRFVRTGDHTNGETAPVEVPIGTIRIRVDSNNDTIVAEDLSKDDKKDEDAAAQGKAFAFWQAAGDVLGSGKKEDDLLDYATMSLRSAITLRPDQRIAVRLKDRTWDVRPKAIVEPGSGHVLPTDCRPEKAYLCDPPTAQLQVAVLNDNPPAAWLAWLQSLVTGMSALPRPTRLGNGVIEIPQALLATPFARAILDVSAGTRFYQSEVPFLFAAGPLANAQGSGGTPGDETVEVGWLKDSGEFVS